MRATSFHLVTDWSLPAPREAVWRILLAAEDWPSWWRAVAKVEPLRPADAGGIGAAWRMTWRSALPYTLTFVMRTTRIEPMSLIEGRAEGELSGVGRWTLAAEGDGTRVNYDWAVDVTRPWQRLVAPVLRPVFAWNHNVVMGWGYEGITRKLAGR